MEFLLDSDTCSYLIKGKASVVEAARKHAGRWAISAVTAAELSQWLMTVDSPGREASISRFLAQVQIVDLSRPVALEAGVLSARLVKEGQRLDRSDVLIAATALNEDVALVTNNTKHFARIAGLRLVNWA